MKLYIVRHGETEENIKGIIQGHLPGNLSKTGILQAKKVAGRLKSEKFDAIYSSDLKRAADTANEIAKHHSETPVHFVTELRERFWGDMQGKSKYDINDSKGKLFNVFENHNGESMEEMNIRARNFLEIMKEKHSNDTVLLVGHNAINKALILCIINKGVEEYKQLGILHNTSVSIFDISEHGVDTITMNCNSHLS